MSLWDEMTTLWQDPTGYAKQFGSNYVDAAKDALPSASTVKDVTAGVVTAPLGFFGFDTVRTILDDPTGYAAAAEANLGDTYDEYLIQPAKAVGSAVASTVSATPWRLLLILAVLALAAYLVGPLLRRLEKA